MLIHQIFARLIGKAGYRNLKNNVGTKKDEDAADQRVNPHRGRRGGVALLFGSDLHCGGRRGRYTAAEIILVPISNSLICWELLLHICTAT